MIHAFAVAALSIASLSVPYVPQTDALCGGAAAAMVFRYWGDAHAGAAQFEALVERRAGGVTGIAADVLINAITDRGWRVEPAEPTLDGVRRRLESRQPVIVLLGDRGDQYHYVVVVGSTEDAIVIHDPSWGPSRAIKNATFEALWSGSNRWSLVVLPTTARSTSPGTISTDPAPPAEPIAANACDRLLEQAIAQVRVDGLAAADAALADVFAQCPGAAGPYRELAGVRFAQRRWSDATSLAREALAREPRDAYAIDVLGSSLFMLDRPDGALRAWNRIGRPQLDLVRIEGVRHTRHQAITEALQLRPNTLLTADAFARARHRLEELPDRASARLDVRPEADGFATVRVAIVERAGVPRGFVAWAGAATRAAVDREATIAFPGFTGQGEIWSASWRWWSNRPRAAIAFAAPRVGGLFGVWRVEASWEAETYAERGTVRREAWKHAGLSVSDWMTGNLRYSLNAGADLWEQGRRAASFGGSLERRWLDDRVSAAGDFTGWLPVDDGRAFTAAGFRIVSRSATKRNGWAYEAAAGAERVSDAAPAALWPGAGEGRARAPLLRAHPLLEDGVINLDAGLAFGRSIQFASLEAQRWFSGPHLAQLGVAAFVDTARASRPATSTQADVGAGLRFRLPGSSRALCVDVARGLRDGATALTVRYAARP